jgi:hypothetical protein
MHQLAGNIICTLTLSQSPQNTAHS